MRNLKIGIWSIAGIFLIAFSDSNAYSQVESIRINEFLALNQTILTDKDGDYSDWIEIYNPTSADIDLLNWSLTDNKSQLRMWVFPDMTLRKESYLVVFASGKNRRKAGEELHTNFKISGDGEYLALYNSSGKVVTAFDPSFPVQQTDISFGFWNGNYISFKVPTPGAENMASGGILPAAPVFSRKHGFFDSPFSLEIWSADPEALIYYTTNGNAPDVKNGKLYDGPLNIVST